MAYSKEFRGEVLAACDAGRGTREVATHFDVSESWVRRIKQERRESGKIAPKSTRSRKHIWDDWSDWLREKVESQPDIYLHEMRAALKSEHGVDASETTFSYAYGETNPKVSNGSSRGERLTLIARCRLGDRTGPRVAGRVCVRSKFRRPRLGWHWRLVRQWKYQRR